MDSIFEGTSGMFVIVVIGCFIVLVAMGIDLFFGISKARIRGEKTSSRELRRSLNKFIMYEGGMLIASGIDLLVHFSHMFILFNLPSLQGIPVVTCILGILLLTVEILSLFEKADEKTKADFTRASEFASKYVSKDEIVEILSEAIKRSKE